MIYTSLSSLVDRLNKISQETPSIYTVLGKEEFLRKQAVGEILHLLGERQKKELYLKNLEGESVTLHQLLEELFSPSLFAEGIVVIIERADKLKKGIIEALLSYLVRPTRGVYLILSASHLSPSSVFYKALEKEGILLTLGQEKPWEKEKMLGEWVKERFVSDGKKVLPSVCALLAKQMKTDRALLEQEIEKIVCYTGERSEVTQQDIEAVGCSFNQETGWQLGEAILRFDEAAAVRLAMELLEEDNHVLQLLAMLRKQIETSFQVCSILSSQGSKEEVSRCFPYMQGQLLERHIQLANDYGLSRFKRAIILLQETEMMSKNSQTEGEILMIKLIAHLTSK